MKVLTWNMQGAFSSAGKKSTSVWTTQMPKFWKKYDVCLLQEAGSEGPGSFSVFKNSSINGNQVNNIKNLKFLFRSSQRSGTLYITHYAWGNKLDASRCSLAIVSKLIPEAFKIISVGISRPLLCIKIQNVWICTIHAVSGGGFDAPKLLYQAYEVFSQENSKYFVAGDFNREPENLAKKIDTQMMNCFKPQKATHPSLCPKKTLDYGVGSSGLKAPDQIIIESTSESDHLPVGFLWDVENV